MKLPVKVTFRHMEASPALEEIIRARVKKLDAAYPLIRCDVVLEAPHHHARRGRLCSAHVSFTVPGAAFAVTHEPHEDPYVAVRLAFEAARRNLARRAGRRTGRRHESTRVT